jgi:hypothetical protein
MMLLVRHHGSPASLRPQVSSWFDVLPTSTPTTTSLCHASLRLDWWIIHTWVRMLTRIDDFTATQIIDHSAKWVTSSVSEGDAR